MNTDPDFPAPWRCCRLQVLAFVLLNLLGSCSRPSLHTPAAESGHIRPQCSETVQVNAKKLVQSAADLPAGPACGTLAH